jgi:hypothetical protein
MAERWNFLMIAGPDGAEAQVRFKVEDVGSGTTAAGQYAVDGSEVPVDEADVDYEAPEWKAKKIMAAGGVDEARFEALKREVKARLGA